MLGRVADGKNGDGQEIVPDPDGFPHAVVVEGSDPNGRQAKRSCRQLGVSASDRRVLNAVQRRPPLSVFLGSARRVRAKDQGQRHLGHKLLVERGARKRAAGMTGW